MLVRVLTRRHGHVLATVRRLLRRMHLRLLIRPVCALRRIPVRVAHGGITRLLAHTAVRTVGMHLRRLTVWRIAIAHSTMTSCIWSHQRRSSGHSRLSRHAHCIWWWALLWAGHRRFARYAVATMAGLVHSVCHVGLGDYRTGNAETG